MFKHKVDHQGRITLPIVLCEKFNIKKGDTVDVSHNNTHIIIKKYQEEKVCAITGELSKEGYTFGNAFISKKGLNEIKKTIKEKGL